MIWTLSTRFETVNLTVTGDLNSDLLTEFAPGLVCTWSRDLGSSGFEVSLRKEFSKRQAAR